MKKLIAIFALIASQLGNAQATAVVSDVAYEAKRISFTISGDLLGYAEPAGDYATNYLSILYTGNLFAATSSETNFYNGAITGGAGPEPSQGSTGGFGLGYDFTWMILFQMTPESVFSGTPFSVSWYSPVLNPAGTGEIQFLWGNPSATTTTMIQSFSVANGVVGAPVTAVPEAETYALLLAGLSFIGFASRRRRG
ncbi:PEP-CTERM protein-sorting domain-containing protein [Duganella sp. CF517]|uniref:PEP-CTERM sorting domain-containing protein n=1 Tax=Duganella sp. CF517 TaxID=1881038 RepID=UPI0008B587A0|nr:PEP-CTERM sorting domain-containing protein [Duganella sp. CF517]SEN31052.1 PEP-CTERM protein-sorting domain-containing protein [Duganella sp. CF517]